MYITILFKYFGYKTKLNTKVLRLFLFVDYLWLINFRNSIYCSTIRNTLRNLLLKAKHI